MKQGKGNIIVLSLVSLVIGFMMAIQFQTNKDPKIRDTRNISELRLNLQKERERSQQLTNEISKYDQLLYQYETSVNKEDQVVEIMENELKRIKKITGYEEMTGEGFVIRLEELPEELQYDDYFSPQVYDDDLRMIVNELNAYGAKAIAINGQRIVAHTAIRNVGQRILVNTIPIRPPFEVKVIGDSSILIPALKISGLDEYFLVVNHSISYEVQEQVYVPAFLQTVNAHYLQPFKEGS